MIGAHAFRRILFHVLFPVALVLIFSGRIPLAHAQQDGQPEQAHETVALTESPRDVISSFLALRDELETMFADYLEERAVDPQRARLNRERMRSLLDMSQVPEAEQDYIGGRTVAYLLDIFGRIRLPQEGAIPDAGAFDGEDNAAWRIPSTPLRITRIPQGERAGEFLFEARTVKVAPRFYEQIKAIPLRTDLPFESWVDEIPQLAGSWFPPGFASSIPAPLRSLWLGTPVWKTMVVAAVVLILAAGLAFLAGRVRAHQPDGRIRQVLWQSLTPALILVCLAAVPPLLGEQLVLTGEFARILANVFLVLAHMVTAWLFWLAARLFFEWLILSPNIKDGSLDADLLRLLAGVVGLTGVVIILAYAGHLVGLPVMSVVAGLGIGGIAVALAVRPTLENLIGGIILYIDKPVRVGDFCSFGTDTGTVESIGVRSTQIRALDRTLISIPNAQFADMKLVNWAHCDRMLILTTIGLRFETTPDQLRFFLAEVRKMFHAHPRIDPGTVRVRYEGPGENARNVNIRVYALTADWNDFFAIREDVFLRIDDLVAEAGAAYAFPSRTLYLGRDEGLDETRKGNAEAIVDAWRQSRQLPFPRLSEEQTQALRGTLEYPPHGSVESEGRSTPGTEIPERLSAEPQSETPDRPNRNE
ncbi:mechanosensitive ion channel family protein [Zhengella sp. ZM62]|uniref:mechanosensitive ion channel family protein n=1 Tax=Zhengella sedimenti TaxID=3390035 RepID=UPI003975990A